MVEDRAHVHLIATGGTIASSYRGLVSAAELPSLLAFQTDDCKWTFEDAERLPSSLVTPGDQVMLSKTIDAAAQRVSPDAVVVTHGTDTMEESAFVADMLCEANLPIVFTGAMRDGPHGDGRRNIQDAAHVGITTYSPTRGVVVVMQGEIHAASEVRKLHANSDDAFYSKHPLGRVGPSGLLWRESAPRRLRLPIAAPEQHIWLIRLAAGDRGEQIHAAIEAGVRGIVIEIFGAGNAAKEIFEAAELAASRGIGVCIVTRCGDGHVKLTQERPELVVISNLDGLKARLALMIALGGNNLDALKSFAGTR